GLNLAKAHTIAALHFVELHLVIHASLFQLALNETDGQWCCVNGDFLALTLQLRNQVWQCADMILMAVRNENAAEVPQAIKHEGDVRNDQVDTALRFFRELAAGIEQQQVVATLDGGHILTDLTNTAEWNHAKCVVTNWPCCGEPATRSGTSGVTRMGLLFPQ